MKLGYLKKLFRPHIIRRIFIERFTEPIHVNILTLCVAIFGNYRQKILFDLVLRQNHAFCLNEAFKLAKQQKVKRISAIEFGVSTGGGLMNICKIANKLGKIYDIEITIFGFDTGEGMPVPLDFRDHPELYQQGDFKMDQTILIQQLPENCHLILGPIEETLQEFIQNSQLENAPLGFISFDLDYYSSTNTALELLKSNYRYFLPKLPLYFDDLALWSHNSKSGEWLSIKEFNDASPNRVIEQDSFLKNRRIFKSAEWLNHIYFLHVLDAEIRTKIDQQREKAVLDNPYL